VSVQSVLIYEGDDKLITSILSNHLTLNGIDNTLIIACPRWMNGSRKKVMTL
jgi:hypothetical protein